MRKYILVRALYSVITLWLLVSIVFAMVRLTGDPVKMKGEVGADATYLERIRHDWGLDQPLYLQYANYIRNLLLGDFAHSFEKSLPVRTIYFALLGLSMPGFFVGMVVMIIIGIELGCLPVLGKGNSTFAWSNPSTWVPFWFRDWSHLVMPAFALGWYFSGVMLRITRSGMLDVLGSDYIKLVRLKGVPERMVVAKHALKNSMIPVLTFAGLNLLIMVNVAVVIEVIFNWPGVGQLLYDGLSNRDFPMVQGVVLMSGLMIVILNFTIDVLYGYVDPRIRLSR